jgi:hypothetical protein
LNATLWDRCCLAMGLLPKTRHPGQFRVPYLSGARGACVDGLGGARVFDVVRWSGAVMCAACLRSAWLLALMKSADRLPDHSSALGGARAPWVLPIPGSRPVRHHISPPLPIRPDVA